MNIRLVYAMMALVLVGAGCAEIPKPSNPESEPVEHSSYELVPTNAEDAKRIAMNIEAGIRPVPVEVAAEWSFPEDIHRPQIRSAYRLSDGTYLAFVLRPNMNWPLYNDDGSPYLGRVSIGAVIFTQDNGKTWRNIIESPFHEDQDGPIIFNPVGMSLERTKAGTNSYVIDFSDARGAGSGEGNLVRYRSLDGSKWDPDTTCYYFLPENYYPGDWASRPGASMFLNVKEPFSLEKIACPSRLK